MKSLETPVWSSQDRTGVMNLGVWTYHHLLQKVDPNAPGRVDHLLLGTANTLYSISHCVRSVNLLLH